MKKKVIINTSTFVSSSKDNTPSFINSLIESLSKNYVDLEIIVLRPMKNFNELPYEERGYRVIPYKYFWPLRYQNLHLYGLKPSIDKNKLNIIKVCFLIISQFFALLKIFKSEKPDYIYSQWFMPQGFTTALAINFSSAKFYCSSYGADVLIFKNIKFIGKRIIRYVVKKCDNFTAISQLNYSLIEECVGARKEYLKKGKVIPLAINDLFYKVEKYKPVNNNNFLYIGRLVDYKGVDLLIDSLKLIDNNLEYKLNVLGDGVDKNFLVEKVKDFKLENKIIFHGWKKNSEKIKYIIDSDVVFVPSVESKNTMEGGPLTLVEALSQKKIVICSDSIGYGTYIKNGINGIKFESGKPESLVAAINYYNNLTRAEKIKIAEAGYELSLKFQQKEITDNLYNFLFK